MMNRNGPSKKRSDELRRARAAAAARKTTPAAVRRTVHGADYAPPPVMVRRAAYPSAATPSASASRGRRRYNVPLTTPGAELRLPALPQIRIGWRLISLIVVAIVGFALYRLWTADIFRVQAAQISGLERLTARDLNAIMGLKDQPSFMLDPQRIERELQQAFPELTAVTATIELPATVLITVTERTPVLAWRQEGMTVLVDAQGLSFPNRDDLDVSALPLVEAAGPPPLLAIPETATPTPDPDEPVAAAKADAGATAWVTPRAKPWLTPEMVSAILLLKERAPQNVPIVYDPVHGFGWQDGRGWQAVFGDEREMALKLQVYKTLVKRLTAEDIQPVFISVEVPHAPYYREGRGKEGSE